MSAVNVFLDIPHGIQHAISMGRMVRDGGVVRWALGTPKAGKIVAHLHEVLPMGSPATVLLPAALFAAAQMVSTAYLARRLNRIEEALGQVRAEQDRMIGYLQQVMEDQLLRWTEDVSRGHEFLGRAMASGRLADFDRGRERFIDASGSIRHWMNARHGEQLLERSAEVEHLLRADAAALAGELACMAYLSMPYDERAFVVRRHGELWHRTRETIETVPTPTQRMPTLVALQTLGRQLPRWRRSICEDLRRGEQLAEEQERLLLGLQDTPEDQRQRISQELSSQPDRLLVFVAAMEDESLVLPSRT